MNRRQLAKLSALAASAALIAPQIMPHIPAQHHGLAGSVIAILAILGGGAMESPLKAKQSQHDQYKATFYPPKSSQK